MIFLILVLAINVLIASWNAYLVGRVYALAKGVGVKLLLWCGLIQSVIGYSSALMFGLGIGAYELGWLDEKFLTYAIQLWYLGAIFPALGTGMVIWLHSVIDAVRNPSAGGFLAAGWNTYATFHNIGSALRHVPEAIDGVGEFFGEMLEGKSGDDGKGKIALLVVLLALGIGIILTHVVFAMGRRTTANEIAEIQQVRRPRRLVRQDA